ncbi:helix-turn-helix domain-containing protein [Streptomyces sp. ISL-99]|uniref:helix-turn-helix domain-containing protein n=1 Tax=Streptomyces sp. ISL-99 TaxID=2819193 RepID=UPI001BE91D5D|nr:helix-turn-helix domain-containing protein [Streptomyces sp. ISL-99]MBT2524554.1 helix-turn-helix domain-containing protein [Streptomyces sp. ISL-99]
MDVQHLSAPPRASSGVPRAAARSGSGVVHANTRHTSRYTVVGNHLTQHRELTLVAIGLAAHIQSLPAGARIGIKCLADRFPESEARIAAALRELEAHGYLERTRERLPNGRIVTHTVSYNQPEPSRPARAPKPAPQRPAPPARRPKASPPRPAPADVRPLPAESAPAPTPAPEPEPVPAPEPAPQPHRVPPPLPEPRTPDPARHRVAAALLADLRRDDPRLLLAERDVERLAPAVAAWLERGAAPQAVRGAMTANLPEPPRHPAALLAHRLTALLPPPLPPAPRVVRPDPFQTCEDCDRAFRAPEPGRCRDCRPGIPGAT